MTHSDISAPEPQRVHLFCTRCFDRMQLVCPIAEGTEARCTCGHFHVKIVWHTETELHFLRVRYTATNRQRGLPSPETVKLDRMGQEVITVGKLREILHTLPDDMPIVLSNKASGGHVSPLRYFDASHYYVPFFPGAIAGECKVNHLSDELRAQGFKDNDPYVLRATELERAVRVLDLAPEA